MSDATQTSGLPNTPTGENRLLAFAHWLVALLIIHWVITCGRKLAAALYESWGPDDSFLAAHFGTTDRAQILTRITRALRRATELQADLFARRPTEQGFPIEARYAVRAQITDICRDLGFFPRAHTSVTASRTAQMRSPRAPRLRGEWPTPSLAATYPNLRAATGPPAKIHRGGAESAEMSLATRVYPGASPGAHPRLFRCTPILDARATL
jgi:hypothetical protein